MIDEAQKRMQEKATLTYMVKFYCRKKHHQKELCPACEELLNYALHRIDVCPFMESKTFCSACPVHCYEKQKREEIRDVMRYSGMRMLFHKPIMALRHVWIQRKEKKK